MDGPTIALDQPDWQPKIWGRTRTLVDSLVYCCTELDATAGGYSSIHYHRDRANRFTVLSGCLEIWVVYGWTVERVRLTDGNRFDVPSRVVHAFFAVEDTRAMEEYWADRGGGVRADDIVRLNHGGRLDAPTLESAFALPINLIREGLHG